MGQRKENKIRTNELINKFIECISEIDNRKIRSRNIDKLQNQNRANKSLNMNTSKIENYRFQSI